MHTETLKKNDQGMKTPAAFGRMIPNDYIILYSAPEMPPVEADGKQVVLVDANNKTINAEDYLNARKAAALEGNVYNPEIGFALIPNVAGDTRSIPLTLSTAGLAHAFPSLGIPIWGLDSGERTRCSAAATDGSMGA